MGRPGFLVVGAASLRAAATAFSRFGPVRIAEDLATARRDLAARDALGIVIDESEPTEVVLRFLAEARGGEPCRHALVVVSDAPDPELLNGAFEIGASVVHAPLRDGVVLAFARAVTSAIACASTDGAGLRATIDAHAWRWRLSPRETELLAHAVQGTSREQILAVMGVSENTLKTQIRALLRKADSNNLDELVGDVLRAALPVAAPVAAPAPIAIPLAPSTTGASDDATASSRPSSRSRIPARATPRAPSREPAVRARARSTRS